jgi:hypothetical protein
VVVVPGTVVVGATVVVLPGAIVVDEVVVPQERERWWMSGQVGVAA